MRVRPVIPWLLVTVVLIESLGIAGLWLRVKFDEGMVVPHAIYATGQLVDVYHSYYRTHGEWPPPGMFVAKEVKYVRTFTAGTFRYDVFDFGGGQYVDLELHPVGRVEAQPVTAAAELRDRSGGSSG